MSLDTFGELNWLAVLVAAAAYFAIGGLWYSPVLFQKPWMETSGIDPQADSNTGAIFVFSFIFNLIGAVATAFLAEATGASDVADGILLGLVVGIGYVVSTLGVTQMFENKPGKLMLINNGYHIVGLIAVAIIVSIWD